MDEDDIGSVPLVIDNGGGQIKADFAGTVDHPRTIFETLVGKPKHTRAMIGVMPESELIGPKAQANRGILQLRHPIERGVVTDWDAMEKIWSYVYQSLGSDSAAVQTEDHPVLLTEAVQNPVSNRQKAAEVLFESFSIPALYVPQQATLSLYASGRTTGLVLNCGDGVTHAVPIVNGFALPHATTRADYGGRDVTERLQLLARAAGYAFHTSAEKESVRMLKEAKCYVAFNPSKEERYQIEEQQRLVKDNFELPDGRILQIGAERFRAPELLFDPTLIGLEFPGIHQVLVDTIFKADLDLRKQLFGDIVLAGGSTMFPGFGDRLLNEVRKLAPKDLKIRISAPAKRQLTTWQGGSILASLTSFKQMWWRRDEYQEQGDSLLFSRKF